MAVPKRKTTPSKRNMRRSHHRAGTQLFAEDKKSGELRRPHHIDLSTGMYRGKQIIIKKTKKEKINSINKDLNKAKLMNISQRKSLKLQI